MISLPEQLMARMKSTIPKSQRSQVVAKLLEIEVQARENNLYKRALELENCKDLGKEMAEWDVFFNDGLEHV